MKLYIHRISLCWTRVLWHSSQQWWPGRWTMCQDLQICCGQLAVCGDRKMKKVLTSPYENHLSSLFLLIYFKYPILITNGYNKSKIICMGIKMLPGKWRHKFNWWVGSKWHPHSPSNPRFLWHGNDLAIFLVDYLSPKKKKKKKKTRKKKRMEEVPLHWYLRLHHDLISVFAEHYVYSFRM